jgi:hypothetical protein
MLIKCIGKSKSILQGNQRFPLRPPPLFTLASLARHNTNICIGFQRERSERTSIINNRIMVVTRSQCLLLLSQRTLYFDNISVARINLVR